jgi:hypothetical protein
LSRITKKRNFNSLFNRPKLLLSFPTPPGWKNFRKKIPPTLLLIQIGPYIANEEAKKFLFDLIHDPDRLTGFFKLSAEKNGLIAPLFKNKLRNTEGWYKWL